MKKMQRALRAIHLYVVKDLLRARASYGGVYFFEKKDLPTVSAV